MREVLKQALEALRCMPTDWKPPAVSRKVREAITAAEAALSAAPVAQGEPVAWMRADWSGTGQPTLSFEGPQDPMPVRDAVVNPVWTPLYAAPVAQPVRKPLTVERIRTIADDHTTVGTVDGDRRFYRVSFARAIERECAERWGVPLALREGGAA